MKVNQPISNNGNRQSMSQEPDPQVVPKAKRRQFSAQYKLRILAGAEANFRLEYKNEGGYENTVMIRNDFSSEAPILRADPEPTLFQGMACERSGRSAIWQWVKRALST